MNSDVLLVIDFSRRELISNFLVKHFLQELGLKAILCSRFNLAQVFNAIRPAVVVVPNATLHLIREISRQAYVFLLPSESGIGQRNSIRTIFGENDKNVHLTEMIDWVFCWGPKMAEWLEEDGIYPRQKLLVTGHPAMDHHLVKKKIFSTVGQSGIGITTAFTMLNSSQGQKLNPFMWIYTAERTGGNGSYFESPYHSENWVFYEAAYARLLGDIVEALAIRRHFPIRIRPHPMEKEAPYHYFSKLTNGKVKVEKKGPISDWLETTSVLLTHYSTSQLDAVIQGVPVISLGKLINRKALAGLPRRLNLDFQELIWQPDNLESLVELCSKAVAGQLPVSPCVEELNDFIHDHFLIPRTELAALGVAREIKKVLERGRKSKKFVPIGPEQPVPFYRSMLRPIFPNIDLLWFYLYGLSPGSIDIRFTYLPWKLKENREALRSADRIINAHIRER